jgi:hypothetical protein
MLISKCSLGHIGLVTDYKKISYADKSTAMAYTGYHIWPFSLIGKQWSSRNPRKII